MSQLVYHTSEHQDLKNSHLLRSYQVQAECIPQAVLGMDVLCQAKAGMGKTAVFLISSLQQLTPVEGEVSVVIICHTRELAFQSYKESLRLCKFLPQVRTKVIYGATQT